MGRPPDHDQLLAAVAANLSALADPAMRRSARLFAREEALSLRFRARQHAVYGKLFDSLARFGGGSLLTSALLLLLGGKYDRITVSIAGLTLLCFVGGAMLVVRNELRAARADHVADRLEAVLKETER